jgi:hypothetical protein
MSDDLFARLIQATNQHIWNAPRNLQKLIGPSEIGIECLRCLAKKLLQMPQGDGRSWYPAIGTAVHEWWLQDWMTEFFPDARWENKVTIGIVADRLITGHADLFVENTVVDLKVVGPPQIKAAKIGPKPHYRTQVHCYGRGFELAGETVEKVAILHMPRSAATLAESVWWEEPYDRQVAIEALARAERIYSMVTADPDVVKTLPRAEGCYDCPRFPALPGEDEPTALPKVGTPWEGIL